MISKEEARSIAHSYIDGVILQESCNTYMTPDSFYAKAFVFDIYYRNEDGDSFYTFVKVDFNGVVTSWNRSYIPDESNF